MRKSGFVAIAGRPNAGKSTLLNRILGSSLSIVTPKAQTTRERTLGILTEEQGQIVFVDTPGIHRAKPGGINEFMVEEARSALEAPTVVWYMIDPRSELKHEEAVIELLAKQAGKDSGKVFLVMNKCDGPNRPAKANIDGFFAAIKGALKAHGIDVAYQAWISALKGDGVDELLSKTWEQIPEGPLYFPDEDQLSDRPMRFFVAEKIREQLLLQLGEEIPYSCAVEITSFQESLPVPRIESIIYVERDSQKGMVVGQGGVKIKGIGSVARGQIEKLMGQKVFLGLQVKVLKDWSRDPEALRRLGYNIPRERGSKKGRSA